MLNFLKRWLGWDESSGPFDFDDIEPSHRPRSATAHVFANGPRVKSGQQNKKAAPAAAAKTAPKGAFDPYNTGKFDRSASWERISRSQR